jgi:hypothetical protein
VDSSTLAVLVLLGLVVLRAILLAVGVALIVRPVSQCPACLESTTWLLHRPVLRYFAPWLEWRFCTHCGWQGPSRRETPPARVHVGLPERAKATLPDESAGSDP